MNPFANRPLRIGAFSPDTAPLRYFEEFSNRRLVVGDIVHALSFGETHINNPDLVILLAHGRNNAPILRGLRQAFPDAFLAAWLWDNHLAPRNNVHTVENADAFFISHAFKEAVRYFGPLLQRCIGHVPSCCGQWSRDMVRSVFDQTIHQVRSDALYAAYVDYPWSARSQFLRSLATELLNCDVLLMDPAHREQYFGLSKRDQLRQWCSYKSSVVIPVNSDLSTRLFDALVCGHIPIASDSIVDLDRVVPPDMQRHLPILRFRAGDFGSLRKAHAEATSRFDEGGVAAARARHRFAVENHMLESRIASMVASITRLADLRVASPGS